MNKFPGSYDVADEYCGMEPRCYVVRPEGVSCKDTCPHFLAFKAVCEADRKMREMERRGDVYRP